MLYKHSGGEGVDFVFVFLIYIQGTNLENIGKNNHVLEQAKTIFFKSSNFYTSKSRPFKVKK